MEARDAEQNASSAAAEDEIQDSTADAEPNVEPYPEFHDGRPDSGAEHDQHALLETDGADEEGEQSRRAKADMLQDEGEEEQPQPGTSFLDLHSE